jgi:flagellar hook protein FlgE
MTFNSSGVLTAGGTLNLTNIPWVNGSDTAQDIAIDLSGFTQYANLSAITAQTQDGKGVGTVTSLSVGKDGQLFALLSNGQSSVLGSIALANFANVEGLTRVGSNLMTQSNTSGEPIIGVPQSGPFGEISAGALELSTSDIASEFVKLIQLQRGFQASTRVVTTINQLLNDIIQLA